MKSCPSALTIYTWRCLKIEIPHIAISMGKVIIDYGIAGYNLFRQSPHAFLQLQFFAHVSSVIKKMEKSSLFHQDINPAPNRTGPPSGSHVSCLNVLVGAMMGLNDSFLSRHHVEPLDYSFQAMQKHVSMAIRDSRAPWSRPKMSCHHVIHDTSYWKNKVSCHTPQNRIKARMTREIQNNPSKNPQMLEMIQVRAMSGEVLWGPQEGGSCQGMLEVETWVRIPP